MVESGIRDAIIAAIKETVNTETNPEIIDLLTQDDFSLKQLTSSSLKKTEFCLHIEETFHVEVELDDLLNNASLSKFSAWLVTKIAAV